MLERHCECALRIYEELNIPKDLVKQILYFKNILN